MRLGLSILQVRAGNFRAGRFGAIRLRSAPVVFRPWLGLDDQKLAAAMLTRRFREGDRPARRGVLSEFLAVRTLEFVKNAAEPKVFHRLDPVKKDLSERRFYAPDVSHRSRNRKTCRYGDEQTTLDRGAAHYLASPRHFATCPCMIS
jgi:hypothetical protein